MGQSADADRRNTAVASTPERADNEGELDVYLTDETFLYRLVNVRPTESGDVAEIEDCYRLDAVRVPMRDLLARDLRFVRPR